MDLGRLYLIILVLIAQSACDSTTEPAPAAVQIRDCVDRDNDGLGTGCPAGDDPDDTSPAPGGDGNATPSMPGDPALEDPDAVPTEQPVSTPTPIEGPGAPGTPTGPGEPVSFGNCRLSAGDVIRLGLGETRDAVVAAGSTSAALAWSETRIEAPDLYVSIPSMDSSTAAGVNVSDSNSLARGAGLTATSNGWLAGWVDNRSDNFEVYLRPLGPDGAVKGEPVALTDNLLRDDAPTLLQLDGQVLVSWVEERADGVRVARTRWVDEQGQPVAQAQDVTQAPASPSSLTATTVGGQPVLAWTESELAYVLPLDARGRAAGTPVVLNEIGAANGMVDIAGNAEQGAAVFTVVMGGSRQEVHVRSLDDAGLPTGPARALTVGARQGTSPSVVRFLGGYAVAYRAFGGGGIDGPSILLAMVSEDGTLLAEMVLSTTTADGPRPVARATAEGQLWVGWGGDGDGLSALQLDCKS